MTGIAKILLASVLLAASAACKTESSAETQVVALQTAPLTIKSGTTAHQFTVEIARSSEEQMRGLMFRQQLDPDKGMIFPMIPPRVASFWMKDTLIPLDMIFVRADGTIARIESETAPGSLQPISSGEPVIAVLEIAGGRAAQLGIAEEDIVTWTDSAR